MTSECTTTTKRRLRVLLRVDIQNSFMPEDPSIPGTGELAVLAAHAIVPTVNKLSACKHFDLVIDTQDFHPEDHESFYTMHPGRQPFQTIDLHGLPQVLWPPHCRQGTPGADFYPTLDRSRVARTFQKGTDRPVDSYSGFYDNGRRKSTGLAEYLRVASRTHGCEGVEVYVVGVTRPYCVTFTARDSASEGFTTFVIADACSMFGDFREDTADRAKLEAAGVTFINSGDILGDTTPSQ